MNDLPKSFRITGLIPGIKSYYGKVSKLEHKYKQQKKERTMNLISYLHAQVNHLEDACMKLEQPIAQVVKDKLTACRTKLAELTVWSGSQIETYTGPQVDKVGPFREMLHNSYLRALKLEWDLEGEGKAAIAFVRKEIGAILGRNEPGEVVAGGLLPKEEESPIAAPAPVEVQPIVEETLVKDEPAAEQKKSEVGLDSSSLTSSPLEAELVNTEPVQVSPSPSENDLSPSPALKISPSNEIGDIQQKEKQTISVSESAEISQSESTPEKMDKSVMNGQRPALDPEHLPESVPDAKGMAEDLVADTDNIQSKRDLEFNPPHLDFETAMKGVAQGKYAHRVDWGVDVPPLAKEDIDTADWIVFSA